MKAAQTATAEKKTRGPAWRRGLRAGGRLALIAILVWASWSAAVAWLHLLDWLPFHDRSRPQEPPQEFSLAQLAPFPGDGYWAFPGLPGKVQAGTLASAEVEPFLAGAPGTATLPAQRSSTEKTWLDLAKKLATSTKKQGSDTTYQLDHAALKAVVFTKQVDGVERLLAARLAWPMLKKQWQYVEFLAQAAAPAPDSAAENLLPLPAGAELLCTRTDGSGQVYCQVITTPKSPTELATGWQAQGWTVKVDTSAHEGATGLICTRGAATVIVWAGASTGQGVPRPVLLLRGDNN
jgi:hypothetical protein